MKNLNKFTLRAGLFGHTMNLPATVIDKSIGIQFFDEMDRLANDMPREVDICGIEATGFCVTESNTNGLTCRAALGLTNHYDDRTNIFEFEVPVSITLAVAGNADSKNPMNVHIGNFHDTIFTLKKFSSEVNVGNAAYGEIFLNIAFFNLVRSVNVNRLTLDTVIRLYYK